MNRCNGSTLSRLPLHSEVRRAVAISSSSSGRSALLPHLQLGPRRLAPLEGRGDELAEQGVGLGGLALELGVELDGQEPGVVLQFDDLDELAVGAGAGDDEAGLLEDLAVGVVELVAMPV